MHELKAIVTGTGRCGTLFMANALTDMGVPCGHEAVFGTEGITKARETLSGRRRPDNSEISKSGTILSEGLELVADSSYMAAPFLVEFDVPVIHVVRNPIRVIGSLVGDFFRNFSESEPVEIEEMPDHHLYEGFMYEHVPDLRRDVPQIDRACLFYLRWNEMIESSGRVSLFHRVEDPLDTVKEMFGFVGDCYSDSTCNSFSWTSRDWRLSEIDSPEIRSQMEDIMRRYGYEE